MRHCRHLLLLSWIGLGFLGSEVSAVDSFTYHSASFVAQVRVQSGIYHDPKEGQPCALGEYVALKVNGTPIEVSLPVWQGIRLKLEEENSIELTIAGDVSWAFVQLQLPEYLEWEGALPDLAGGPCGWEQTSVSTFRVRRKTGSSTSLPLPTADFSYSDNAAEIDWAFGLGESPTGRSYGSVRWFGTLNVIEGTLQESVFDWSRVLFDPASTGMLDVNVDTTAKIRQIRTPSALVEITDKAGTGGFFIRYFEPLVYTDDPFDELRASAALYAKKPQAIPFCVIEVTRIGTTAYRVIRRFANDPIPEVVQVDRAAGEWRLRAGGGQVAINGTVTLAPSRVLREVRVASTHHPSLQEVHQRFKVYTVTNAGATRTLVADSSRVLDESFGYQELKSTTRGPDLYTAPNLRNTFVFSEDSGDLVQVRRPDGGWTAHTYNAQRLVSQTFEPFLDLPTTPTTNPVDFPGKRTIYIYAPTSTTGGQAGLPAEVRSWIGGTEVSRTSTTYEVLQSPSPFASEDASVLRAVSQMYSDSSTFAELETRTYHRTQSVAANRLLAGLPRSLIGTDGTQSSFRYARATIIENSGDFDYIEGPATSGFVQVAFHGTRFSHATADGTTPVTFDDNGRIEPIFLIPFQSTREIVVRDGLRRYRRTEVFTGSTLTPFESIGWTFERFTLNGQLEYAENDTGIQHQVPTGQFQHGLVRRFLDAQGIEHRLDYDFLNRATVTTIERGSVDLRQTLIYDGVDRILRSELTPVDAGGQPVGAETLYSTWTYDLAGELTAERLTCGQTVSHSLLAIDGLYHTRRVDRGNGRISDQKTYRDGRLRALSGPAVVERTHSYGIGPDGFRTHITEGPLENGTRRFSRTVHDWSGRMRSSASPSSAPNSLGHHEIVTQFAYYDDPADSHHRGKPKTSTIVDLGSTLFQYDLSGARHLQALDVNGNGSVDPAGTDRVAKSFTRFVKDGQDWWAETVSSALATNHSAAESLVGRSRVRLTGWTGGLIAESRVWGPHASPSEPFASRGVRVDRSFRRLEAETRSPGVQNPFVEIIEDGLLRRTVRPDGVILHRDYDSLDRLVMVESDRGIPTYYHYYPSSPLLERVENVLEFNVTHYEYEECGSGRVSRQWVTYDRLLADGTSAPTTRETRYQYDSLGNLRYLWGTADAPVQYEYNAYGEPIRMHTYRGGTGWDSPALPDAFASATKDTTHWTIAPATGLVTAKTDAVGASHVYSFDQFNRLQHVLTPRGKQIAQSYRPVTGELASRWYPGSSASEITPLAFFYDRLGRAEWIHDHTGWRYFAYHDTAADGALNLSFEAYHDAFYGAGVYRMPRYDAQDRWQGSWVSTALPQGVIQDSQWTFDPASGLLRGVVHAFGGGAREATTTYGYHSDPGSGVASSSLPAWRRTAFTAAGSAAVRTSLSYETASSAPGRNLVTALDHHALDAAGDPVSLLAHYGYSYDPLGQVKDKTSLGALYAGYGTRPLPRGHTAEFFHDVRGQLTQSHTRIAGHTDHLLDRRRLYGYDGMGNRTSIEEAPGETRTHTVNALNQYTQLEATTLPKLTHYLTGEMPPFGWFYDLDEDAITWEAHPDGGQYFYWADLSPRDPANEFEAWAYSFHDAAWMSVRHRPRPRAPDYDLDGNMTSDGGFQFAYDAENRLIGITDASHRTVYRYDYLGRRVEQWTYDRSTSPETLLRRTRLLYDGWHVVAQFAVTGGGTPTVLPEQAYGWGPDLSGSYGGAGGIGGLQAIDAAGGVLHIPGYDREGNVTFLWHDIGGTPTVGAVYEYDPFGREVRVSGAAAEVSPFRYQTKWNAGVQAFPLGAGEPPFAFAFLDYGLRWYHPELGRFLNRDPIGEAGGLNLHRFVGNNPMNRWDFLGLDDGNYEKEKGLASKSIGSYDELRAYAETLSQAERTALALDLASRFGVSATAVQFLSSDYDGGDSIFITLEYSPEGWGDFASLIFDSSGTAIGGHSTESIGIAPVVGGAGGGASGAPKAAQGGEVLRFDPSDPRSGHPEALAWIAEAQTRLDQFVVYQIAPNYYRSRNPENGGFILLIGGSLWTSAATGSTNQISVGDMTRHLKGLWLDGKLPGQVPVYNSNGKFMNTYTGPVFQDYLNMVVGAWHSHPILQPVRGGGNPSSFDDKVFVTGGIMTNGWNTRPKDYPLYTIRSTTLIEKIVPGAPDIENTQVIQMGPGGGG
jgi:RHS repeat-associated protein